MATTSKHDVSIVAPLYVNNYLQQTPVSFKVMVLITN